MERRDFVRGSLVTSAGFMTTGVAVTDLEAHQQSETTRLKLSVIRVALDEALDAELRGGHGGPCPVFEEGQEFIIESPYFCPDGFCAWAWADIRTFIMAAYFGAESPQISCCTDGVRPVFFRIERTDT